MSAADCPHINAYQDDFLHEWHCDDCGAKLDGPPAQPDEGECEECNGDGDIIVTCPCCDGRKTVPADGEGA